MGTVALDDSSTTHQLGNDLVGSESHEFFGTALALSSNGSRLVVAIRSLAEEDLFGAVQVFDWKDKTWTPVGGYFFPKDGFYADGFSLVFSSDGNRLVMVFGPEFRNVYIFDWTGNTWTENVIELGRSCAEGYALSSDGNRLAIRAIRRYDDEEDSHGYHVSGRVRNGSKRETT